MKTNATDIIQVGLLVLVMAIIPLQSGCATSRSNTGATQSPVAPMGLYAAYTPIQTYKPTPPPTIHWYGTGNMMVPGALMNRIR